MRPSLRRLVLILMILLLPLQGVAAAVMPWCGSDASAGQHADHHAGHQHQADSDAGGDAACSHCTWCLNCTASAPPAMPAAATAGDTVLDPPAPSALPRSASPDRPYRPPLSTLA